MSQPHIDTSIAAQNAYILGASLAELFRTASDFSTPPGVRAGPEDFVKVIQNQTIYTMSSTVCPGAEDFAKVLMIIFTKDTADGPSLDQKILATNAVISDLVHLMTGREHLVRETDQSDLGIMAQQTGDRRDLAVFLQDKIETKIKSIQEKTLALEMSFLDGSLPQNVSGLLDLKNQPTKDPIQVQVDLLPLRFRGHKGGFNK